MWSARKKPDPEIYLLALEKNRSLLRKRVSSIEDSRNGVLAADKAGMHIVATTNILYGKMRI